MWFVFNSFDRENIVETAVDEYCFDHPEDWCAWERKGLDCSLRDALIDEFWARGCAPAWGVRAHDVLNEQGKTKTEALEKAVKRTIETIRRLGPAVLAHNLRFCETHPNFKEGLLD